MSRPDEKVLAGLAADYPAWHVWRSRDGRGRDDGWNATRRRKPGRGAPSAGVLGRVTADSAAGLRGLLEQQAVGTAPGPVSSALGVCDKEAEARRAAAARLLGGLTPAAVIERANQEAPWLSS